MFHHPLSEGMKTDACPLPECCFSSNSSFWIPLHTSQKSIGTGKKNHPNLSLCRKAFLGSERPRLLVSGCLPVDVLYDIQNSFEKILKHRNYPLSSSPSATEYRWAYPCMHIHVNSSLKSITGQSTVYFSFFPPWIQVLYSSWCLRFSKLLVKSLVIRLLFREAARLFWFIFWKEGAEAFLLWVF